MTTTAPEEVAEETSDRVEAVLISGPRRGDLIMLSEDDLESEEVASAVRLLAQVAEEAAANATALRQETEELVAEMRSRREAYESHR